ncbi:MAG: M20 family metallo-hydrolase [Spirochaetaceae bacterium]|nr:M20 family metallo-hydrolase [Spirochaetaceae bacterium]MBO4706373.1 M20 family metallo-hydrolase [Spirochaetaceae bacterium]
MKDFETLARTIDAGRKEIIELETLLTSIPALAPESDGNGELDKCEALEGWLKKNGITKLERFDAPDSRAKNGIRPNLVATIDGEDDDLTIWVMAHLDVVPVGELSLWKTDPWKVVEKDGKIYGRGVEDDQQGLVSGVFAALAFIRNGVKPAHTVKLLFVADEEVGSTYGIQYLLKAHKLFRPQDLIIIPDGGDSNGETVEVAEKNLIWLKVRTLGKQSHGSRPDEGANAFLANCELAMRLNALETTVFNAKDALFEPDHSTFQPTKKEANVPNINTIPGEDVFYMDCRILPQYTLDVVRAEFRRIVAEIEKKYGVKIETSEEQAVESPATPVTAPVVNKLSEAIEKVSGRKAKPIGIGGGTVGAYLRIEGYQAVVWGTLDETAHQPNEYCIVENLIKDAKILLAVML